MSDTPDLRGLNDFVGQKYDEIVDQMYSWLEENFDDIAEYNDWEKALGEDVSQLTDFGWDCLEQAKTRLMDDDEDWGKS